MIKKIYYWLHRRMSKPEERGEYSSGHWQSLVRIKALELSSVKKGNFLEVGCGEGLFIAKLAQQDTNLKIYGLDNRQGGLLKAKWRSQTFKNINLIRGDAQLLPFEDNSFESIVCINVFFNFPSKDIFYASLTEIMRVCKYQGSIIFDIRNKNNLLVTLKYKLAKYYDATLDHSFITFRLSEVKAYLEKNGFRLIRQINAGFPKNNFSPIIILEAKKI